MPGMSDTLLWSAAGATISAVAGGIALRRRQQRLDREYDRISSVRSFGWDYQPLDAGFTIVGRQLGRSWELIVSEAESARWSTLTIGAPDIDKPLVVLAQLPGSLGQAQAQERGLMLLAEGSPRFSRRFALLGQGDDRAKRLLDDALEDQLLNWPLPQSWIGARLSELTIWVCPQGVRISMSRPLLQWSEIQHLITLGQTISLRSGIL
jgi:hypothetical protein